VQALPKTALTTQLDNKKYKLKETEHMQAGKSEDYRMRDEQKGGEGGGLGVT